MFGRDPIQHALLEFSTNHQAVEFCKATLFGVKVYDGRSWFRTTAVCVSQTQVLFRVQKSAYQRLAEHIQITGQIEIETRSLAVLDIRQGR